MKRIITRTLITLALLCSLALAQALAGERAHGSFTDSRDGKSYHTVKVGTLTWMAENLNYQTDNSWCYDDNPGNCQKYGRLYDWNTATSACPAGWHLPTRQDWDNLVHAAGGNAAGIKLKSRSPNWNGTDDFGLSALPGGIRYTNGGFSYAGSYGNWWSAAENGSGLAWFRRMTSDLDYVYEHYYVKGNGLSVRCVR